MESLKSLAACEMETGRTSCIYTGHLGIDCNNMSTVWQHSEIR